MFDPTKPVKTRDGREAKILWVAPEDCPSKMAASAIIALVEYSSCWGPVPYFRSGRLEESHLSDRDLVNTPETVKVHLYRATDGHVWVSTRFYEGNKSFLHTVDVELPMDKE